MSILSLGASALTAKPKLIIAGVIIVAVLATVGGTWIYIKTLNSKITDLEKEKKELIVENEIHKENNKVLRDNVKTLAVSNHENWKTAQALIAERSSATKAINNLAAANLREKQALDRLSAKVQKMLEDPKNDGEVAPVLKEVIREIQKERAR